MPDLRNLPLACPVPDTGYLIRGHPDTLENTGFRLEFTLYLIWGRNDTLSEKRQFITDPNY
jgi:hypothetical protein